MVGIVGAPAKRNFGKVTRSHHDTAFLVRDIHQDLGAFTGLHIFVGHVERIRVVADVRKMLHARLLDIDRTKFHAQQFRHRNSVVLGAFRRSEARHREHENFACRAFQQLECFRNHEQCQRRIEPAAKPHDRTFGMRSLDAFRKPRTLDIENFLAVLVTGFGIPRNKRSWSHETVLEALHRAQPIETRRTRIKFAAIEILERAFAQSLHVQAFHVDIGVDDFRFAAVIFRLGKHRSVFCNHQVTAKDHVRRRFVHPRRSIHIGGHATGRLVHHQVAAIVALAHQGVTCGKVHNHIRSGQGKFTARRHRRPQVFAEFHADTYLGALAIHRKEIRHRHIAKPFDSANRRSPCRTATQQVAATREMTFFVELALVRQMNLGRHRHKLTLLHKGGAVVEATEHTKRKPHRNHRIAIRKSLRNLRKRFQALFKQQFLMEQVTAGVPRNAEFGEHDKDRSPVNRLAGATDNFSRIVGGIGDFQRRANRCESVKSKHNLNID